MVSIVMRLSVQEQAIVKDRHTTVGILVIAWCTAMTVATGYCNDCSYPAWCTAMIVAILYGVPQ